MYVSTSLILEGEPVAIQSKILHWPMRNRHGHFTPLTGHCSLTGFNFFKAWSQKTGGGGGGGTCSPRNYGTVCYINLLTLNISTVVVIYAYSAIYLRI